MKKLFLLLLLLGPFVAFANTFVVTSNADSGPGTLREAIQKASDNGSAVRDSIVFNIADVSEAGRTIVLKSTLPYLTSNILIDGTTQQGSVFGVSDAKVELTLGSFPVGVFSFLFMYCTQATNIELYGLFFYQPFNNTIGGVEFQAIHLDGCNNIQIGSPQKGNYFLGSTKTISNIGYSINDRYINIADTCRNITIQSNIDGLNLDGSTSYQLYGGVLYYSVNAISFSNTNNILIGGSKTNEGNHIVAYTSINIQSCFFAGDTTPLRIWNNRLGTNIYDTSFYNGDPVIESNIYLKGITAYVDIKKNILTGQMTLAGLTKYFHVTGNKIYNPDYNSGLATKIAIGGTAGGLIGGDNPGDANQLYNPRMLNYYAITSDDVGVTILKNNIYCNVLQASSVEPTWWDDIGGFDTFGRTFPWVIIDSTANGYVRGRAKANCKIDIYQDDECPACEGKMYLASTTSDAKGLWHYSGAFTGVVVATATDSAGTTFAFSNPFIRDDSIVLKQPTCGKKNGSIKRVKIIGGDNWEWRKIYFIGNNQYDSLYSTKLDVDNLEAGKYILRPKLGSTCNGYSRTYTLVDISPTLNEQYAVATQPTCGKDNGQITGIGGTGMGYSKLAWRDTKGNIVGNTYDITKLFPGSYTLYAIDTSGAGCVDSSKVYTLTNQAGPSLVTDSLTITDASCGNPNGSIKNIQPKNTTGTIYTAWQDSLGAVVGNAIDLVNVPAGRYRLLFKDGGGCDTIKTNYYSVKNEGVITINASQIKITPSSCRGADGSIRGITSTNATIFKWINTATGKTVGNTQDIGLLPPGGYQLFCSNAKGCSLQTDTLTIHQSGFLADTVQNVTISDANCNLNNGYITIHQFTRDSALYSFSWVDSATNAQISTQVSINSLSPGFYTLYATDTAGCKQQIFRAGIGQLGKPQFDYSLLNIVSDTCNQAIGSLLFYSSNQNGVTWRGYSTTGQEQSVDPLGIINLTAGRYYATITDKYNCTSTSDTFTVANYETVPPAPKAADQFILRNTAATLRVTNLARGTYNLFDTVTATVPINTSSGGTFTTPPILYDKQFYLQYLKGDCASPLTPVWVKVYDSTIIAAPNAFSPNGDGINDTWRLNVQGVVNDYSLTIFNRYGQVLYTSTDFSKGWDGTINGKPVPVGTYYYIIQSKDNSNRPVKQTGYVVVLR